MNKEIQGLKTMKYALETALENIDEEIKRAQERLKPSDMIYAEICEEKSKGNNPKAIFVSKELKRILFESCEHLGLDMESVKLMFCGIDVKEVEGDGVFFSVAQEVTYIE